MLTYFTYSHNLEHCVVTFFIQIECCAALTFPYCARVALFRRTNECICCIKTICRVFRRKAYPKRHKDKHNLPRSHLRIKRASQELSILVLCLVCAKTQWVESNNSIHSARLLWLPPIDMMMGMPGDHLSNNRRLRLLFVWPHISHISRSSVRSEETTFGCEDGLKFMYALPDSRTIFATCRFVCCCWSSSS